MVGLSETFDLVLYVVGGWSGYAQKSNLLAVRELVKVAGKSGDSLSYI